MATTSVLTLTDDKLEEREPLSVVTIPVLHGGMVDVALRELGATLVEVCYVEETPSLGEPDVA